MVVLVASVSLQGRGLREKCSITRATEVPKKGQEEYMHVHVCDELTMQLRGGETGLDGNPPLRVPWMSLEEETRKVLR